MPLEPLPDLPCACAAARRAARVLTQFYSGQMRSAQIEASQFALLTALDKQPGCNQEMIGRTLAFDKTTLSRNLKLLQRKGWIEPSPAKDRRTRGFRVTTSGRERIDSAKAGWINAQEQLRSRMGLEEWEGMWKAFKAVTQAAREAQL